MKQRIEKMLNSFTINMDPSNYRRLYRDKAFRENITLPSGATQPQSTAIPNAPQQQAIQWGIINPGNSVMPNAYNVRASAQLDKNMAGLA